MSARRYGSAEHIYAATGFLVNRGNIRAARQELRESIKDYKATYSYAVQFAAYVELQKVFQGRRVKQALGETELTSLFPVIRQSMEFPWDK